MELNFLNINPVKFSANKKIDKKVSLAQKPDIIDISFSEAKKKNDIINELKATGLTKEEALELYEEYGCGEKFDELVNGCDDGYPAHYINTDENLTPSEAILYQAYEMNDYYMQFEPFSQIPFSYSNGTFSSNSRNLGEATFTPVELATMINENNFDIVTAGMVLRDDISLETAKEISKNNHHVSDSWAETYNVKYCEEVAHNIIDNFDTINNLTSDEKDENGELKSGLTRPLTFDEAMSALTLKAAPDLDQTNFYIWVKDNKSYGELLTQNYDGKDALYAEYKAGDAYKAKTVDFPKSKMKAPQNLEELADRLEMHYKSNITEVRKEYLDIIKQLDSDKFFKRIPAKALNFDLKICIGYLDKEQMEKNVQVLNGMSDELLAKIGKFHTLKNILASDTLEQDVQRFEDELKKNPEGFKFIEKQDILDVLAQRVKLHDYGEAIRQVELLHKGYSESEVAEIMKEEREAKILSFKKDGQ